MARFRDPVLKQIVDDLNLINQPPQLLRVDQCTLSDPIASTAGGGVTNTRATLTIVEPDAYYYGSSVVYYRRLQLATLFAAHASALFPGAVSQSKTLLEIIQQCSGPLSEYVQYEVQEALSVPWVLNRAPRSVPITAKPSSLVFIGVAALQASTVA